MIKSVKNFLWAKLQIRDVGIIFSKVWTWCGAQKVVSWCSWCCNGLRITSFDGLSWCKYYGYRSEKHLVLTIEKGDSEVEGYLSSDLMHFASGSKEEFSGVSSLFSEEDMDEHSIPNSFSLAWALLNLILYFLMVFYMLIFLDLRSVSPLLTSFYCAFFLNLCKRALFLFFSSLYSARGISNLMLSRSSFFI